MSEKFTHDHSEGEEKKSFKEKLKDSKIVATMREHSPATLFFAGLGTAGYTADIRPAAIGGAIYFASKYTKEKIIPQLQERKEEKEQKRLFESLPDPVKKDIESIGVDGIIEREEDILDKHNRNLDVSIINLDDPIFDPDTIYSITETQTYDEDGDVTEEKDTNYKIGLANEQSYFDFKGGVLIAQYLLRTKLGENLPEFSEERVHTYNTDIDKRGRGLSGGITEYLLNKKVKDEEIYNQFTNFVQAEVDSSPLVISGGVYLLSLYETQKEVDELKERFEAPSTEK